MIAFYKVGNSPKPVGENTNRGFGSSLTFCLKASSEKIKLQEWINWVA